MPPTRTRAVRAATQTVTAGSAVGGEITGGDIVFSMEGTLSVGVSGRYYPTSSGSFVEVTMSQRITNTSGNTVVEVLLNDTTIGTLTLGVGEGVDSIALTGTFEGPATDYVSVFATSVGDGEDLTVQVLTN